MALSVECTDETGKLQEVDKLLIKDVLLFAAEMEKLVDHYEVAVTIVSDEVIQKFNKEYRGFDEVTDVLSFALLERQAGEIEIIGSEAPKLLGDIVLSYERALEQAREYGHTLQREIGFLVIHGFLHLLGYNHVTKMDEKIMFTKQEQILQEFGLHR